MNYVKLIINRGKKINIYRDVKSVLKKTQDLHLDIFLDKNFGEINLKNFHFISAFFFYINDKGKVYAKACPYEDIFSDSLLNNIEKYETTEIEKINDEDPIEYISKFNKNFEILKSPQAQFVSNINNINTVPILQYSFEIDDLSNIKVLYQNTYLPFTYSYKVIEIDESLDDIKIFKEFLNTQNFINNNLKNYYISKQFFKRELLEEKKSIDWDINIENKQLRCRVDETNQLNVIYQSSFNLNEENAKKALKRCFTLFDNNQFPIIVIEDYNAGGYYEIENYLTAYINLNKPIIDYSSFRYNNDVKINIASKTKSRDIETCEEHVSDYFFNSYTSINYGLNSKNENIIHKRTNIFNKSKLDRNEIYDFRENTKYIRKPTEIIIFTDGFSFSGTSFFIKKTQLNGGAIIVGYGGNPNLDSFDSSQSPSFVASSSYKDDLTNEITDMGFSLKYTIIESFSKSDYEIPLEYKINLIDERIYIYKINYQDIDDFYDKFVYQAKLIFEDYKTKCNSNNKKLLLISEECRFSKSHIHGGYQCDDNGHWSNICVPSYCDNGFIFDEETNECKEDICLKVQKEEKIIYLVLTIVFAVLFVAFLVGFIYYYCNKGNSEKEKCCRWTIFGFCVVFFVLFLVFLIKII